VAPTLLRDAPGGAVTARVGPRTEFGSPRVLPVVRREGSWLAVIAAERPNGELGWVRASRVRLLSEPGRVEVSLSRRLLRVVEDGRTTLRMTVGIGSSQTPTPTGWFAVTDDLHGWGPYGCCIVALSGHQPRLAQGWTGGDRLAVHGSATGNASGSLGCLRADAADLRRLQRVARLGMRVHISS
jgi:lipoprotein-anchoring transpeptidase ErfK/SrfK